MGEQEKICQCISRNDRGEDCLFLDNGVFASVDRTIPSMEKGNFSGT